MSQSPRLDFEHTPLTEALACFGITHRRDDHTHLDSRHLLERNGRPIGRNDSTEGWVVVRFLRELTEV